MGLFEFIFAVLFGTFFCLLALMVFVYHIYGVLATVFLGFCALLVLCLLGIFSRQFQTGKKFRDDYIRMNKEFENLNRQMAQVYKEVARMKEQIQKQKKAIKALYQSGFPIVEKPLEESKGQYNHQRSQDASRRTQQYSKKKQSSSNMHSENMYSHQNMAGTVKTNSVQNQQNLQTVINNSQSHIKEYSVKVQIKGKDANKQPILNVYRDGAGVFKLAGMELCPIRFREGDVLTRNQVSELKAYDILELFEVNSKILVDHKVIRIKPALINVSGGYNLEQNGCFEGGIKKKGEIEVKDPVR